MTYTPETDWFLTAGIGDVLAILGFMSEEECSKVERFHWAMRARSVLQPLMEIAFPHVEHINVWADDPNEVNPGDYGRGFPSQDCPGDILTFAWHDSKEQDGMYRRLINRPFVGLSFLKNDLADVSRFHLPERYDVIQPGTVYNVADHRANRDITEAEWPVIIERLEARDSYGVVLGAPGAEPAPVHERLIDLQGMTSVAESIEVLKSASCIGYVGCDSWVSIVACQLFDEPDLWVKSSSAWYVCVRFAYCAPHKKINFVYRDFVSGRKTFPCDL